MAEFSVLGGKDVGALLTGHEKEVIERVREAYLAHDAGDSVNPDSYFLRFPEKPDSRIIALPAYLGGEVGMAGIKWISSFPANVARGEPRASAVLVLNDYGTGRPVALLEAAGISAARTAASAALACTALSVAPPRTVGVVGGGVIARTVCQYLHAAGVPLGQVRCHDIDPASAGALTGHLRDRYASDARESGLEDALDCDLVLFATTALAPYVPAEYRFRPGQLVLNISLRDLAPETLLGADNILDDIEHCMKANTSPHLAEQLTGRRDFVTGTLAGVLRGRVARDPQRPAVFSPFGLGVLDLAVGHWLYRRALDEDRLTPLPGFFGESRRW
ncbi:2,3-diaminopropionate biosynthesis protein SbnB [Streptomyces rubradiris]|uniref:2,3-diaminopropionate biosynthesis protein SbnB n=1 Tax=Streptomyces rubradiris TaxID=285531 RepID=A0ABQ3RQR8_STRRR|nr:2,3-diaminopropionate biosynthesis protein SbnB [Streptomyces rubradiris]GHH24934.1 2,3-diaminopropionate biosynthesis protein SbnB [Streptomyces rubradiris]GHI58199.1 2,3-diaminopropionate biosynthesis protein SbnB [Streptomyces rubradiris]